MKSQEIIKKDRRKRKVLTKADIINVLEKDYIKHAAEYISLFNTEDLVTFEIISERIKYILSSANLFPDRLKCSTVISLHKYLKTGAS